MKIKNLSILLSLLILLPAFGCGNPRVKGKMIYIKPGASMPDLVAILPPENQSNDLTSIEVVQRAGGMMMTLQGYYALANKAQDQTLREMGISDGGHLAAYKPEEISKKLGVDGLLYTVIEDFGEVNIGFWRSKKVIMNMKLTDSKGESLWQGKGSFKLKKLEVNPTAAGQAFVGRLVGQAVENMMKVHLVPESNSAAIKLGQKITPWPDAQTKPK